MSICTGARCPAQVGYEVEKCNAADCSYRTPPVTNADLMILMLIDCDAESLLAWWEEIFEDGVPQPHYFEEWLKQPYKEDE